MIISIGVLLDRYLDLDKRIDLRTCEAVTDSVLAEGEPLVMEYERLRKKIARAIRATRGKQVIHNASIVRVSWFGDLICTPIPPHSHNTSLDGKRME